MIADALQNTLDRYIDDVLSDRIPTSKLVRLAVERQVRDLARQSTGEFPYHFDARAARKVCSFYPQHLKHSTGRFDRVPFELSPWQVFCESTIYGWKRDADGTRRFRKSYEGVARKNGKSTRAAGRSIYMARFDHNPVAAAKLNQLFVPEPSSLVVLAAMKKEQAERILYSEIIKMRAKSESILDRSVEKYNTLMFPDNDGLIMCTGSDRSFDGLNPHLICLDEVHAWGSYQRDFYDTMVTSVGFRDQPLISIITTAGDDGSDLWIEIYDYITAVLNGTIEDEQFFAFSAELDEDDDPFDEANWIKANPNLGVSVFPDYLRGEAKTAKQSKLALNRFMRYCGNRRVSKITTAFDLDEWDACAGDLSDWSKADAICGAFDQGSRDDLGAWAMVARFPIANDANGNPMYRFEGVTKAFISEDTKRDLTKAPFGEFIYSNLLTRSKFPTIELRDSLVSECQALGVDRIAYDLHNANSDGEYIKKEFGIETLRVAQSYRWFNEPIKSLMQAVSEGRFRHTGDRLLRWCISNAVLTSDPGLNVMYDKANSKDKIDPVVALTMAYFACMSSPARATGSLYL